MNNTDHCPKCQVELVNSRCLSCGKEYYHQFGSPVIEVDELPTGSNSIDLDDRINQILLQDDLTFDSVLSQVHDALNTLFICLHAITPKRTQLSTTLLPDEYRLRYTLYFTSRGGLSHDLFSLTIHSMMDDNEFPIGIFKDDGEAIRSMAEFEKFLVSQVKGIRRSIKIINSLVAT